MDKQVESIMNLLGCTEEQAKQVIADDQKIDKGEKLFELTVEQEKIAKKYRQGDRKPTVYKFDKRERKADNEKGGLIELLAAVLQEQPNCTELAITNKERQIDFKWGDRKLRIVLSAPRN